MILFAILPHAFLPLSLSSILLKVLELPDQLLDGNAFGTGAGCEFSCKLRQPALPRDAVKTSFLIADKRPGTLLGFERSLQFKFTISPYHGVWIHGKIDCQLPNRGKLIARRERPRRDRARHLVHNLAVDRDATEQIQSKGARASPLGSGGHTKDIVY
jgi:hypothetical protein